MDKMVHWDIPSTDIKTSSEFYHQLFGWKLQGWSDSYVLFEVEDGVGGGFSRVAKVPEPCIDVYIAVDNIEATLKKVGELGGKTESPKQEIGGGMGFTAMFRDPCGCRIGLWSKT